MNETMKFTAAIKWSAFHAAYVAELRNGTAAYAAPLDPGSAEDRKRFLCDAADEFGFQLKAKQLEEFDKLLASLSKQSTPEVSITMRTLGKVEPEKLEWIWPGRIALGKYVVLAGNPGVCKGFASMDVIARITTGREWPDCGQPAAAGDVIIVSTEDDIADTIRPRLDAAGADVDRVHELVAILSPNEKGQPVELPFTLDRVDALEAAIDRCNNCRLIWLDPIDALLPDQIDSHKNAQVRSALSPLVKMLARRKVALLGVHHFNKARGGPASHRIMGSLAFVAASRAAWGFAADRSNPERRFMLPVKGNLGPDVAGLAFRLVDPGPDYLTPRVEWEADAVNMSIDECLMPDNPDRRIAIADAKEWLQQALTDGPMEGAKMIEQAAKSGHSERTLRRARKDAGILSYKGTGYAAPWYWKLPDNNEE